MKPKFIDEYAKMYNDYIDGMYNYIDEFYFVLTVLAFIALFIDVILGIFFLIRLFCSIG